MVHARGTFRVFFRGLHRVVLTGEGGGWCPSNIMNEEVREMLAKLKLSKEETKKLFTMDSISLEAVGWEAWAMENLLTEARVKNEAMYRVLRSLWYTNDWVNFVEVGSGCFLIMFGFVEDRDRIFNMAPLLFDQHILSMVPYVIDKWWEEYEFSLVSFWVIIFNIPMERKVAMEV